jgi:pantetheine-phosphate adenylyltransferase
MKTIAIYCGTFNPFHIGHLNIVEKSERIFGKGNVIVAMGVNPDKIKNDHNYIKVMEIRAKEISDKIEREVITYSNFQFQLVEEYEKLGYNVVLIRGLRNGVDLDYEVNQMRFTNDFKKDINVVYITCDKEFEHISSSAIRSISEFGGYEMTKRYLV